jgi:mRNA interferase MazF
MKSPQRGEVWLVDLGMAAKVRPALAISVPVEDVDRALVTLVPHTRARGSPDSKSRCQSYTCAWCV